MSNNFVVISESPGWEWGVLGDPLVSAWETRDLNSVILEREAHAVTQFINSDQVNKTL